MPVNILFVGAGFTPARWLPFAGIAGGRKARPYRDDFGPSRARNNDAVYKIIRIAGLAQPMFRRRISRIRSIRLFLMPEDFIVLQFFQLAVFGKGVEGIENREKESQVSFQKPCPE